MRKKWKQIMALLLAMALLSSCGLENKLNNDAAGNDAGTNGTATGVPADGDSSAAAGFRLPTNCPTCSRECWFPAAAIRRMAGKR